MHYSSLAALVLALGCAQAATISKDAQCGSSVGGATCLGSSFGNCCSVSGWCGATSDYCGSGCQSAYGTCGSSTSSASKSSAVSLKSSAAASKSSAAPSSSSSQKVSPDATCGGTNGYTCQRTSFGSCCSSNGWCGATSDYCGTGCQSKFGTCTASSSTPSSINPSSSAKPSTSAKILSISAKTSSASAKPSSTSVKPSSTAKASSVTVHRPISTDATCGSSSNGATCRGSVFGNCCSNNGYCGSTDDFCNNCQASYGNCGTGTGSLKYPLTIPSAGTIPSGTQCGVTGSLDSAYYDYVNLDDQACALRCKNDSKCKSFVYWYMENFYIGTPKDQCYLSNQTVSAIRGTDDDYYTFYDKACAVPAPVPADPVLSSVGPYCEFKGDLNGATAYKTFSGTPIGNGSPFYQMPFESDCKSQCQADANCQSSRYVSYPSQSGHPSGTCYYYNTTAHSPSDLTYRPDTVDIFNDKSCS